MVGGWRLLIARKPRRGEILQHRFPHWQIERRAYTPRYDIPTFQGFSTPSQEGTDREIKRCGLPHDTVLFAA